MAAVHITMKHNPATEAAMIAHYAALEAKRKALKPPQKPVQKTAVAIAAPTPEPAVASPPSQPERRPPYSRPFLASLIIKAVCRHYKVKENAMMSIRREAAIVRPRFVAIYLVRELTAHSMPSIGLRFGGRDHTTVLNAIQQIERRRKTDPKLNAEILALLAELDPPVAADPNQLALPLAGEGG